MKQSSHQRTTGISRKDDLDQTHLTLTSRRPQVMNPLPAQSGITPTATHITGPPPTTMQYPGDAAATIDPGKWSGEKKDFKFWWQRLKCYLEFKEREGMTKKGAALLILLRMGGTLGETLASNKIRACEESDEWPEKSDLLTEIEKVMGAGELEQEALKKLEVCRQCGRPVADFLQEFALLQGQTNVSDDFAKHLLERAVDYDILQDLYTLSHKRAMLDDL